MRALFGDFHIFILLLFSFNAPNAAPSRHKVPIFTHFFFSSLSLFVSVCVICGGKHGVSAFCKFSQRYFFVNRELAGAVFCAGILRLRAHLKAKAGIGAAEWATSFGAPIFLFRGRGRRNAARGGGARRKCRFTPRGRRRLQCAEILALASVGKFWRQIWLEAH